MQNIQYIVEGPDRAGKTTYAKKLVNKYGLEYEHLSHKDDRSAKFYLQKLNDRNKVYDRLFISEYVYSKVLERETDVDLDTLKALVETAERLGWRIVICLADDYNLTGEPDFVVNNHEALRAEFERVAKDLNLTIRKRGI